MVEVEFDLYRTGGEKASRKATWDSEELLRNYWRYELGASVTGPNRSSNVGQRIADGTHGVVKDAGDGMKSNLDGRLSDETIEASRDL